MGNFALNPDFKRFLSRSCAQGIPCSTCGKMAKASWEQTEAGDVVLFVWCHGQRDLRVMSLAEIATNPEATRLMFSAVFVPTVRVWSCGVLSSAGRREERDRRRPVRGVL